MNTTKTDIVSCGQGVNYDAEERETLSAIQRQTVALEKAEPIKSVQTITGKTPQEMRVLEVSEALLPAYQRAGTLDMTEEEILALTARFPDELVEVRPHDGLCYIPHIHISKRLNQIFRPGKWALIRRREWYDAGENVIYGEYVLIIRGIFVGESIGGHQYVRNNPKTNYSDALESTAAEALRRICGKRLDCGDQVWDPSYCREWEKKWRGFNSQTRKWFKKNSPQNVSEPIPSPDTGAPAKSSSEPKPAPKPPICATPEQRLKLVERLSSFRSLATEFFNHVGALMPNETLEELPLTHVPTRGSQLNSLMHAIGQFEQGEVASMPWRNPLPPFDPVAEEVPPTQSKPDGDPNDPDSPNAVWRSFPMPFGKHAGIPLADLDKKYLYGLVMNFQVETEYKGKPRNQSQIAKDEVFRGILDMAGRHYEFKLKEEQ